MPSYQPKVSTKHKDYPCRLCGRTASQVGAKNIFYDKIDEANAAITAAALRTPICRDCFCLDNPGNRVCLPESKNIINGEECCWRCGMGRKSKEIRDGVKCNAWGQTYSTHIWSFYKPDYSKKLESRL